MQPRVGNTLEWDEHYSNFERQKRKISRVTQHSFNLQAMILGKNNESSFRETLDFEKSERSRKNKTMQKSRRNKHGHVKEIDRNTN